MTKPLCNSVGIALTPVLFAMILVVGSVEADAAIALPQQITPPLASSLKTSEAAQSAPLKTEPQKQFPEKSSEASSVESEVPTALLAGVIASALLLVGSIAIFGNKSDDFIIQENISDQEEALTKGKVLPL